MIDGFYISYAKIRGKCRSVCFTEKAKYEKMSQVSSFSLSIQENRVSLIRMCGLIFVSQQEGVKKMKPLNTDGEYRFAFAQCYYYFPVTFLTAEHFMYRISTRILMCACPSMVISILHSTQMFTYRDNLML